MSRGNFAFVNIDKPVKSLLSSMNYLPSSMPSAMEGLVKEKLP